jgi:hypothetical protein
MELPRWESREASPLPYRTFTDTRGRVWEVWEVQPAFIERRSGKSEAAKPAERRRRKEPRASLPNDLRGGWLAFQYGKERRRLTPTPSGWEEMSDTQLAELVERATPARQARRLIE